MNTRVSEYIIRQGLVGIQLFGNNADDHIEVMQ